MKKILVTYKDTDMSPKETRKYDEEVDDMDEAISMLKIICRKLRED